MRQAFSIGPGRRRRGMALVAALVTLAIVSTLMASIAWHITANRRMAEHRRHRIQAGWLARGGLELAAAGLLGDPERYKGESAKPIEQSQVRITVEPEAGSKDVYKVVSEARYPTNMRNVVVHSVTRRMHRVVDGEQVRIEVLAEKAPAKR